MARFLVYSGITTRRSHPTKPLCVSVERAEFADENTLDEVRERLAADDVIVCVIRLDGDPIKLAKFLHPAVVAI